MRNFPSICPLKPQYSFKRFLEQNVVKASDRALSDTGHAVQLLLRVHSTYGAKQL